MNDHETTLPALRAESNSLALLAKAEIDMQISTARAYPRSIKQFVNTATEMVTLNEEVADSCNYALPRGGKVIEGPSARFAELIVGAWGHTRSGARVVHSDGRFVTAQGICHDLQTNTMRTMEVQRRITDKHGKTFNDDMIGVTGNAAASIAIRNAILQVVPKAFWHPIYQQARLISMGDSKTLVTRRADALSIMLKFGVTLDMVLARLELKGVEDITIEHLAILKGAVTSIRDGAHTAEALFPAVKPDEPADKAKGSAAVKDALKKDKAVKAGADPETGELTGDAKPKAAEEKKREDEPVKSDAGEKKETKPSVAEAKPAATSHLISLKMMKGSTEFDVPAWRDTFIERVKSATTLEQVGAIYRDNVKTLNQFKSRQPDIFAACDDAYLAATERLSAAQ